MHFANVYQKCDIGIPPDDGRLLRISIKIDACVPTCLLASKCNQICAKSTLAVTGKSIDEITDVSTLIYLNLQFLKHRNMCNCSYNVPTYYIFVYTPSNKNCGKVQSAFLKRLLSKEMYLVTDRVVSKQHTGQKPKLDDTAPCRVSFIPIYTTAFYVKVVHKSRSVW